MNKKKLLLVFLAVALALGLGAAAGRCSAVFSQGGDAPEQTSEAPAEDTTQNSDDSAEAKQEETVYNGIKVDGLKDSYLELVDGKEDALKRAITTYCRANVPDASKVTFDGEVYLDLNANAAAATFHCNDVAATILQVTYEGGSFAVAG